MKRIPYVLAVAVIALSSAAQTTSRVDFHSAQDMAAQYSTLIDKAQSSAGGSASDKLGDFGTHSLALSVRTKSGGAEFHAHYDDVLIVVDGAATEVTGGTIVDPQSADDGEMHGLSITGGDPHPMAKGDVIHILAGTPHQMLLAPGATIRYFVVKIREN